MSEQKKKNRFVSIVLESIGAPLVWGLIATFVYYFLVSEKIISSPLVARYTAGHPVEYIEVALFFMGLVAIMNRAIRAFRQSWAAQQIEFKHRSTGTLNDRLGPLLAQIEALPNRLRNTDLALRMENALVHVKHNDSAQHLEDEIKYLSDLDAEKNHQSYALVRMIIWATPMLGFLGTVIGITLALGDLSPEALVNSPKEAMEGLLAGLSVAFDTTALALSLSIVLMFAQFLAQQIDTQLLALVDRRTVEELGSYFRLSKPTIAMGSDESLHAISDQLIHTFKSVQSQQAETLQSVLTESRDQLKESFESSRSQLEESFAESNRRWATMIESTGTTVQSAIAGAVESAIGESVEHSLELHAASLEKMQQSAGEAISENWERWHATAADMLRELHNQQVEMSRHGEILNQTLHATGEVMNLEKALNQNLRALAHAKNFEDTVMSLSAAIQLLSTRLNRPVSRESKVKLDANRGQERAA